MFESGVLREGGDKFRREECYSRDRQNLPQKIKDDQSSRCQARFEQLNFDLMPEAMFDTICSIPLASDLFTQAIHPTEPVFSIGLASGRVHTFRLPAVANDESELTASDNGFGQLEKVWRTRRHEGSCRTLGFSVDGSQLYSAGTDEQVKAADAATGQVVAKILIPKNA